MTITVLDAFDVLRAVPDHRIQLDWLALTS